MSSHAFEFPAATLESATSQLCTEAQFDEPTYRRILGGLGQPFEYHRKQWEYIYILRVLEQFGLLYPGYRGCGFGCGREPLIAYMAARGCHVLATDIAPITGGDHYWGSLSLEDFYYSGICDWHQFSDLVNFQNVDMNAIPTDLGEFDFVWSSCALEHLGSLQHGLDFVLNALSHLRPGGVAVHTTEMNLSSNDETLESPGLSLYRWRDIEALAEAVESRGHRMLPINRDPGSGELDRYVDLPPYSRRHVKLAIAPYTVTSIGFAIVAGA